MRHRIVRSAATLSVCGGSGRQHVMFMATAISIPACATSVGYRAFAHCSGATAITPIGIGTCSGCSDATTIAIPASGTSVGYRAFAHCSGATAITIPASGTSIGQYAFCLPATAGQRWPPVVLAGIPASGHQPEKLDAMLSIAQLHAMLGCA